MDVLVAASYDIYLIAACQHLLYLQKYKDKNDSCQGRDK